MGLKFTSFKKRSSLPRPKAKTGEIIVYADEDGFQLIDETGASWPLGAADPGEHSHPQYAEDGHDHGAAEHPDLATHETLGLAAQHDHPYAADVHAHDYAATGHGHVHDHDGTYAAPHAHPYSADDHTHPGGAHDHDADYSDIAHAHAEYATDADLTTHAGTAHGLSSHAIDGAFHSGSEVLPTQGQKNALAGTAGTPGTTNQYVTTQDTRLSDARTPTAHTHDYADPAHTHNLTDGDIPASIARDAEVTAAVDAHAALADPHPGYLTTAEGNAAYEAAGAVTAHAGAANPHPTYATDADLTTHAATPHGGQGGERYKVGDLYITTTNYADGAAVATAEGYGTWSRFGVGRFLLLTDGTAGQTGGSATHGHTFTQPSDHAALTHAGTAVGNHAFTQPNAHTDVPTHTHTTDSQGAHVHDEYRNSATTGGLDGWAAGDTSTSTALLTGYDTGSGGAHTHTAAAPAGAVASQPHTGGAVDAHSVTQPSQHAAQSHAGGAVANGNTDPLSITAYAWLRTA